MQSGYVDGRKRTQLLHVVYRGYWLLLSLGTILAFLSFSLTATIVQYHLVVSICPRTSNRLHARRQHPDIRDSHRQIKLDSHRITSRSGSDFPTPLVLNNACLHRTWQKSIAKEKEREKNCWIIILYCAFFPALELKSIYKPFLNF